MHLPYAYNLITCPGCQEGIDTHVLGFCTGLGPPLLTRKCRCIIESGRREWVDFQSKDRIRFILTTAAYAVVAAFWGGINTCVWFDFESKDTYEQILINPAFLFGAIIWVIFVAALQRYRISRSLERKPTVLREAIPVRVSFWNIDFNLQVKFSLLFILILLVTYIRLKA